MNILAIDTSGTWLTVACGDRDGIRASFSEDIGNQHSEKLVAAINGVLERAGVPMQDIGAAGVVIGPGSFTGLRVGISFAKGLAMALGIGTVGINSLDALARVALGAGTKFVSPVIDARKGQVYAALYDVEGQAPGLVLEYSALAPMEWFAKLPAGTLLIGSGVGTYHRLITAEYKHLVTLDKNIATITPEIIYAMSINGIACDPLELDAFYIRQADAVCKPKQR